MAKHGYGCFQQWYESIGFNKDNANRLIRYSELIIANCDNREFIETLPKSLSNEIARPSAPQELKQAVLNGDITTHKEYQMILKAKKEAERRAEGAEQKMADYERMYKNANDALQEAQETAGTLDIVNDELESRNEQLKTANQILENKLKTADDPIIVETPVQVFPPDYERIKQENEQLKAHNPTNIEFKQYAKNVESEAEIANKIINALMSPQLVPMDDSNHSVRCYLEYSPGGIDDALMDCDRSIAILQCLKKAFTNTTKLQVVKK